MILIDTDILIDYFQNKKEAVQWVEQLDEEVFITYLTKMELLAGSRNKTEMNKIKKYLNYMTLDINNIILESAVTIFQNHYLKDGIGILDSIICSTAIYYHIDFYSRNLKHYQCVENLKIFKPY